MNEHRSMNMIKPVVTYVSIYYQENSEVLSAMFDAVENGIIS